MRRILLVLTMALVMAAMMVAMAMPAFAVANENANPQGKHQSYFKCAGGQQVAAFAPGNSFGDQQKRDKHFQKAYYCVN